MNIVTMLAHSIESYDQTRLLHSLGHSVLNLDAYIRPHAPMDDKRPPLDVPEQKAMTLAVDLLGQPGHDAHGRCDGREAHKDNLDAAKRDLPDTIIDWMDVLIVHHLEHTWLIPQWDRVKHKRVIWRTVGQSAHPNEYLMRPLRKEGLEIIRYSPKERNIPEFAGEDALIRFYKDPDEWHGWTGDDAVVTNVTQQLYQRSLADDGQLQEPGWQWTSYSFWQEATRNLPTRPLGPGSERIGGLGSVTTDSMKDQLRRCRAYVATGTQPASYVLNFIEALMTGIPVVSVGPEWFKILPYGSQMLEMHELAPLWANDPADAHAHLERMLREPSYADEISKQSRALALEHFAMDKIKAQWREYLGAAVVPERQLVAA